MEVRINTYHTRIEVVIVRVYLVSFWDWYGSFTKVPNTNTPHPYEKFRIKTP
jgi:hypothetical protein